MPGPSSPYGLRETTTKAEERMNDSLREAPKALGTLLSINMEKVLASCKVIKQKICKMNTDIDGRIGENYA